MHRHPHPHSAQYGWALADTMIAVGLAAVIAAMALAHANTRAEAQRTLLIGQQALDLQDTIQRYMATHGGAVPGVGQLVAEGQVPASMVSGDRQRILHAGRAAVSVGRLGNALGDGRMGFLVALEGLDSAGCRTVAHQVAGQVSGLVVADTGQDAACNQACHEAGEIARDFGGDLDAYEQARGPAHSYTREWLASVAPNGLDADTLNWIVSVSDQISNHYGAVTPFGVDVKRSKEPEDSDFNRAFRTNLASACPADGSTRRFTLKLVGRGS